MSNGGLDPIDPYYTKNNDLRRVESLSISPELFEKLYLSPQNVVKGDLRKTFGNPTPAYASMFLRSLNCTIN